jgi:NAD(P)H-hydrate epimerase
MLLSRDQARALDRRAMDEFAVPGIVLMENAGRSMAELLLRLGVQGPVVICCGKGNNGGDGLVIARHLDASGVQVRILLFASPEDLTGDAAVNYTIVARSGIPLASQPDLDAVRREVAGADWVVDALFGSGLQGAIRPPLDAVVEAINASPARVLAVDVPSGLDSDTGKPLGPTVRAHHTATVVAPKKGFVAPEAAPWLGQVHVVGMGAPRKLLSTLASPSATG